MPTDGLKSTGSPVRSKSGQVVVPPTPPTPALPPTPPAPPTAPPLPPVPATPAPPLEPTTSAEREPQPESATRVRVVPSRTNKFIMDLVEKYPTQRGTDMTNCHGGTLGR